jgi:hypothetical protein
MRLTPLFWADYKSSQVQNSWIALFDQESRNLNQNSAESPDYNLKKFKQLRILNNNENNFIIPKEKPHILRLKRTLHQLNKFVLLRYYIQCEKEVYNFLLNLLHFF